jgi:aminoglycoside phosphotransferase (APT) family kinase protein
MAQQLPDESMAATVCRRHVGEPLGAISRFATGLCHYVYDVRTETGAFAVRIASPHTRPQLRGGLYWHPRLEALGVPVPQLLGSGAEGDCEYMVLRRLPGTDLGHVYSSLTSAQKQAIARGVADTQRAVASLPRPRGYGFACSWEQADTAGRRSWADVVEGDIARSEERIVRAGHFDPRLAGRARAAMAPRSDYLRSVEPVGFLDDTTTKNVIVHEGRIAGIVDTDEVCFGDPMFTVGLTNMALLSLGVAADYIGHWLDAAKATPAQRQIVNAYTLVFCLNFMSEMGQTFNRQVEYDQARGAHLLRVFEQVSALLS